MLILIIVLVVSAYFSVNAVILMALMAEDDFIQPMGIIVVIIFGLPIAIVFAIVKKIRA